MDKLSDNLKCLIFERVSTVIPLHFVCKNFYQLCKLYNIQITNNWSSHAMIVANHSLDIFKWYDNIKLIDRKIGSGLYRCAIFKMDFNMIKYLVKENFIPCDNSINLIYCLIIARENTTDKKSVDLIREYLIHHGIIKNNI